MFQRIGSLLKPTSTKIIATICFTLVYFLAAFLKIVSTSMFYSTQGVGMTSNFLLVIINWIILTILLFVISLLVFTKKRLEQYDVKRGEVLISVTVLGLLLSHLFFEMPRFLWMIIPSFANFGDAGAFSLILVANLLLSYLLFSLMMCLMERFKKS